MSGGTAPSQSRRRSEPAVLADILGRLAIESGYVVEFGAWDGVHLSNSRDLIARGWRGLLIEADAQKFAALKANVTAPGVTLVNARVETSGENALEAILARAGAPQTPDLLSIDIDSDDLAVWMSLKTFRARVVIIEYNVTVPFDIDFVNPKGRNWGNGALTIWKFARARDYRLVAFAGMNLVFVDKALAEAAGIAEIALDARHADSAPRYFWGYDGTLLTNGGAPEVLNVPWHSYAFAQPVPRFLRRWHLGGEWKFAERVVSALSMLLTRPILFLKRVIRR
ncbi:MAG: hypothetical protein GC166_14930 [Alphaproteobacteria bacterium]|nr:hypothetical protein [Alphaproteobacteria bacterium]